MLSLSTRKCFHLHVFLCLANLNIQLVLKRSSIRRHVIELNSEFACCGLCVQSTHWELCLWQHTHFLHLKYTNTPGHLDYSSVFTAFKHKKMLITTPYSVFCAHSTHTELRLGQCSSPLFSFCIFLSLNGQIHTNVCQIPILLSILENSRLCLKGVIWCFFKR